MFIWFTRYVILIVIFILFLRSFILILMFILFYRYLTVILMFLFVFPFYLSYPNVCNRNRNPNPNLRPLSLGVCVCGLPFPFAWPPCLPFRTVLDAFQPWHTGDRLVIHCVLQVLVLLPVPSHSLLRSGHTTLGWPSSSCWQYLSSFAVLWIGRPIRDWKRKKWTRAAISTVSGVRSTWGHSNPY